jgi:hypothetical protein
MILEKHFEVKAIDFGFFAKNPLSFLGNIYRTIIGVTCADGVFIWFADFHVLLPIILSKCQWRKTIVVIGGYKVAKVPEIEYGGMPSRRTRWIKR